MGLFDTSNATGCPTQQDMCGLFRGDTFQFDFTFKDEDGVALDISGMTLTFTMKQLVTSPDGVVGDLQESVIFPSDAQSVLGLGSMSVFPAKTTLLLPGVTYSFDFQLADGANYVLTVGWGTVPVKQDITLTVA